MLKEARNQDPKTPQTPEIKPHRQQPQRKQPNPGQPAKPDLGEPHDTPLTTPKRAML